LIKAGAEHQAEQDPSPDENQPHVRCGAGAAREDGEEPRLAEECFPSKAVERLPDVDERQIQDPEQRPHQRRGHGAQLLWHRAEGERREGDAEPRAGAEHAIFREEIKETGRGSKRDLADPAPDRLEAMFTQQRHELSRGGDERHEIDRRYRALE